MSPAVAGVRALSRESELVLNLDKSGNGFPSEILPGEKKIPLNLGLGWSTERGFFLEGGKGNVIKQTNPPPPSASPRLVALSRASRSREVDAVVAVRTQRPRRLAERNAEGADSRSALAVGSSVATRRVAGRRQWHAGVSAALAADVDAEALQFLEVMSGRILAGVKLYAELKKASLPTALTIDPTDAHAFAAPKDVFLRWYEALFMEPAGQAEAWSSQRMEYAFSVEAPTSPQRVLTSEYYEGDLDWYDFDAKMGETLGAQEDRKPGVNPLPITRTTVPAPATYRGMPASRWWEFEDASVDFGAVEAEPDDLARMLLVDFAITYGNDWFVIPVDVPVGSTCKINSLVITDTFGVRTLVPSIDQSAHPASRHWRMFNNSGNADTPTNLFLAPTLKRTMEGKPLDEVLFLRDEMANLAWGVERVAEGVSGRPLNRREGDLARQRRNQPVTPAPSNDGALKWRFSTEVPSYWIPLIPIQIQPGQTSIRFRRGAILRQDGTLKPQPALSQILKPSAGPLDIFEEEIPREGARVTRSFQYARWFDGSPLLWIGKRKTVGRGEGSSGLRFDVAE